MTAIAAANAVTLPLMATRKARPPWLCFAITWKKVAERTARAT
jgi:hypothetical protein